MVRLAETYLHLAVSMERADRQALRSYLLAQVPSLFVEVYHTEGIFDVRVEPGSLKAWIVASALSLVAVLEGYGALRQSLDYLIKDARVFSELVSQAVKQTGVKDDEIATFQRRLAVPGRIKRVLARIDRLDSDRYMSVADRHHEYIIIKALLFDILIELNDPEDRQFVLSSMPSRVVQNFEWPDSPLPTGEGSIAAALEAKTEDWDLNAFNNMQYVPQLEGNKRLSYEPLVRFDPKSHQIVRVSSEASSAPMIEARRKPNESSD